MKVREVKDSSVIPRLLAFSAPFSEKDFIGQEPDQEEDTSVVLEMLNRVSFKALLGFLKCGVCKCVCVNLWFWNSGQAWIREKK